MSNKNITLFHANWSLCSQMVRVAFHEKGIPFISKHIKLCDQYPEGQNLDKKFLSLNPKGTVPVIKHNESVISGSENIVKYIDTLKSEKNINLYPSKKSDDFSKWVADTTITEGVNFASTIGTVLPVFSAPLIQLMVKKLPLKSILKILLRHPIKERKIVFFSMYFTSAAQKFPNIGIKKFIEELIRIEKELNKENKYFNEHFTHIDINMMCLFHRLKDLKLEEILNTSRTPLISEYWKNLQNRESYQKSILDYYTSKENEILHEFYLVNSTKLLEKLKDQLYSFPHE